MPIRPELREKYPPHWRELSRQVRFERGGGQCQRCGRPHGEVLRVLPDGRWFDPGAKTWRDGRGKEARWPDIEAAIRLRHTRVVLAAAHLDNNPRNNRRRNLKGLCQRCHLIHDRPYHLAQRWITYRLRYAVGDLFLGPYPMRSMLSRRARAANSAAKRENNEGAPSAEDRGYPVELTGLQTPGPLPRAIVVLPAPPF